jgi:hypothetical protein
MDSRQTQRIAASIQKALRSETVRTRYSDLGLEASTKRPDEFARTIATESDKWKKVITEQRSRQNSFSDRLRRAGPLFALLTMHADWQNRRTIEAVRRPARKSSESKGIGRKQVVMKVRGICSIAPSFRRASGPLAAASAS